MFSWGFSLSVEGPACLPPGSPHGSSQHLGAYLCSFPLHLPPASLGRADRSTGHGRPFSSFLPVAQTLAQETGNHPGTHRVLELPLNLPQFTPFCAQRVGPCWFLSPPNPSTALIYFPCVFSLGLNAYFPKFPGQGCACFKFRNMLFLVLQTHDTLTPNT